MLNTMSQRPYCNVSNKGSAPDRMYRNSKQISLTEWELGSEEGAEVSFELTYMAV